MKKHFLICFTLLVCLFSHYNGFSQSTLLGSPTPTNSESGGEWTDGYTFTPNINITVTNFRTYFGEQAFLWNSSGTLLETQAISSPEGVWTNQAAFGTPLVLTAGQTYTIGILSTSGSVWYYDNPGPTTFANGTIGPGLEVSGDAEPSTVDNTGWMVDLVYTSCTTVNAATIGTDQTICYNTIPATLTTTVAPTGGDGTGIYTYQWQSSPDGSNWSNINNATSSSYSPGALTSTTYYQQVVTSGSCGSATSNTITITVDANLVAGTIGSAQTICYNTTPAGLTSSSLPTGGTGSYTYLWQSSPDNSSWTNINTATGTTYSPGALTSSTYFRRTATSGSCGTVNSNSVLITVDANLVAGTIGSAQTICYNTTPAGLTSSSLPTGGTGSYTYLWQSSPDNSSWTNINAATGTTYSPGALTSSTYYRRGETSGSCGTVYSNSVLITVHPNLVAGTVAASQTICYNTQPAAFTSTGLPTGGTGSYTYQWQVSTDDANWNNIGGATSTTYAVPAALTSTTYYQREETSGGCGTVSSNTLTVTVDGQLLPGTIAANQSICYNTDPAPLTGTAPSGGTGSYTYNWQTSADSVNWLNNLSGGTPTNFTPPFAFTSNTYIRRQVTSGGCGTVNSNGLLIIVGGPVVAGTVGTSQTICYNTVPAPLFNITSPTGGYVPFTYQWQSSADDATWTNIGGATSAGYAPGALTATTYYRRIETTGTCGTVMSNEVAVAVYPNLVAGSIASDQTICYNTTPAGFTSTTLPTGGTGNYAYQWESSTDGVNYSIIQGATASTYTAAAALTTTTYFHRAETSGSCGTVYSNMVTVTVYPNLVAGTTGSNQLICNNSTPAALTNIASPTGGSGSYTYQWQTLVASTWTNIGGASSPTYAPGSLTTTTYYRRVETSGAGCGSVNSNIDTITVGAIFAAGTVATNQIICNNTVPAALNASLPTGGVGNYTYQWQSSLNGTTWTGIGGATSASYAPGALTTTTDYRVQETSGSCGTLNTGFITVTVDAAFTAGSIGSDQTICYNATPATLTITTPSNGGSGTTTYQWQSSPDGNSWTNIGGATNNNFAPGALTSSTYYRLIFTSVGCGTANSNAVLITVYPDLVQGTIAAPQTICNNTTPQPLYNIALPTGGTGSYTYQWQSSPNGSTWTNIGGATSTTYSPGILSASTYYQRVETSGACGSVNSDPVLITVYPALVQGTVGNNQTICYNTTPAAFTSIAPPTGGNGTYTYQWSSSTNGINYDPISLATSATFAPAGPLTRTTYYQRAETSGTCGTVYSNIITITVDGELEAGTIGTSQAICYNTTPAAFTNVATPTGGTGSYTYQWQSSPDSLNWSNINGQTSATYAPGALTATTYYRRQETSGGCGTVISNVIIVTVGGVLAPGTVISSQSICYNTAPTPFTNNIPASGGLVPFTYQWQSSPDLSTWTNINGATSSSYTSGPLTSTTYFRLSETSGNCGTVNSNFLNITVGPPTVITVQPVSPASICVRNTTSISITATGGFPTLSYQWQYFNGTTWNDVSNNAPAGAAYTNQTTNDLTISGITAAGSYMYRCVLNDGCVQTISNSATLVVNPTLVPSATLTPSPAGPICAGTNVQFTVTPVNGGTAPTYDFYISGNSVQNGSSPTFSSSSLLNGNNVSCILTSNAVCANPTSVLSNRITMTVEPYLTPSVTITANPGGVICAQTGVTFTATPVNGGSEPTYQWLKNGNNVGTNSSQYYDAGLQNGDVVSVEMTSNYMCLTTPSAISNGITMTVNPLVQPAVTIQPAPDVTICAGTNVTFSATAFFGGNTPEYIWMKDGNVVGSDTDSYSDNGLNNGDFISVVLVSDADCASSDTAASNVVPITVNPLLTPSINITANPGNSICAETSVTFTAAVVNGGTSPSFQWQNSGNNVGTNSTVYTDNGFSSGDVITCILTSNAICATASVTPSNSITMDVTPVVTPSVVISANPSGPICSQTPVTFTAIPTNGGGDASYQWQKNGVNVGANSNSYTDGGLNNNDVITVIITSSEPCASPATATSNSIQVTVNPILPPTISITPSPAGAVCAQTNVTFNANITNGGSAPNYNFEVNGVSVQNGSSPVYSSTGFNNLDQVTCILTSNATCAQPTAATSSTITMTVTPLVTPSVSITSSAGSSICTGTNVTFTATAVNGGSTPAYQWFKDGSPVGTNSQFYVNNSLQSGDIMYCMLTSNATCTSQQTATSGNITMTVNPLTTPSILISANPAGAVCAGSDVTFSASTTNAGEEPGYQWMRNGLNVGANTNSYTSSILANGDLITCVLTSSALCASPPTVISDTVVMQVTPIVVPTVSITSNLGASICKGANVIFNATSTNGGGNPTYQWVKNGFDVGSGGNTFQSNTLANGDTITCQLFSSANCAVPVPVTAQSIGIVVTPLDTPTVSISQSPAGGTICAGTTITYSTSSTNGGLTPVYEWFNNGVAIAGANNSTYSDNSLATGSVITCVLISSEMCALPNTDTSNSLSPVITANVSPTAFITGGQSPICAGQPLSFVGHVTNQGASPIFQWVINGHFYTGPDDTVFNTTSLVGFDTILLTLSVDTAAGCFNPSFVYSNTITVTVNPVPATPEISQHGDTLVSSSATGNQWYDNGIIIPGATHQYYVAPHPGDYQVLVTNSNSCSSDTSFGYNFVTTNLQSTTDIQLQVYPNPANNLLYIQSGGAIINTIEVIDMLGQTIAVKEANQSMYQLDVTRMNTGNYILIVRTNDGVAKKLFTVARD